MQTVTNTNSLNPLVTDESQGRMNFIIIPAAMLQHFSSFGYASSDLMDYRKLRDCFSQDDLAQLFFYNQAAFYGLLNKKIDISPGFPFFDVKNINAMWGSMTEKDRAEFENVILPMSKEPQRAKAFERPRADNKEELQSLSSSPTWRLVPSIQNDYYVIVVSEDFLRSLQVRATCQAFVSECLQADIARRGIDTVQRSNSLYYFYLKLLQMQSQGVLVL